MMEAEEQKIVETGDESILIIEDKLLGDKRITWRKGDARSAKTAEKYFNDKMAQGWFAYKFEKRLTDGEQILKFDARAERIALIPPMVGG
jgi:hypothetical protein